MSPSPPSILIVEDEVIVAADLAGKLDLLGYRVAATTATGEQAVELARQHRPDLVLMDIRLAGAMDGVAAAAAIRRELDLPVIFLTAHSDAATINQARQTGASAYVRKPFDDRELRTRIDQALRTHGAERRRREGGS
jgi:CheY-like chemotaxis protein